MFQTGKAVVRVTGSHAAVKEMVFSSRFYSANDMDVNQSVAANTSATFPRINKKTKKKKKKGKSRRRSLAALVHEETFGHRGCEECWAVVNL